MFGTGGFGHPSWGMWQSVGIVLTVAFCITFTSWFADKYWDPLKGDVDTTRTMQVLVENPDGSMTLTMRPTFSGAPTAEAEDLKENSKAWLYIFVLVVVMAAVGAKGL